MMAGRHGKDRKDREEKPENLEETSRLVVLDPAHLKFSRVNLSLRLSILDDRSWLSVVVKRSQPLTNPGRFLCVLSSEGGEVGVLEALDGLDPESRQLVEEELRRRYVAARILRVLSVKERFGTVEWVVETERGRRDFSTQGLRELVRRPSPFRLILVDVDENRYDIPDIYQLDQHSRELVLEQT